MTWQPISTAPKDGTPVDIWVEDDDGGARFPDMIYREGDTGEANDWCDKHDMFDLVGDGVRSMNQVTHWMPIPAGPNS